MFARFYTFILLLGVALSPASLAAAGRLQPVHPEHEIPGPGISGVPRDSGRALTDWLVWEQSVGRTSSRPAFGGTGFWALAADEFRLPGFTGAIAFEFPHSRATRVKVQGAPSTPRAPPTLG